MNVKQRVPGGVRGCSRRLPQHRAGLTQLRLAFAKDDNNDRGADYLKFSSGNAAAASRPALVIGYSLP